MFEKIERFRELADGVSHIIESNASWETKHEIVFKHLKPELEETEVEVEWCSTDTSYMEAVVAYARAVEEKSLELFRALH